MYGLILEGIGDAIRRKFGDEMWEEMRKKAGVTQHSFNMHKTYSETVIPRLAKAGSEVTGRPIDEVMELCGYAFVAYVTPYGYDRVLRILGRHLRDLLGGLDNLHEYLKFSYPKMKPPSFFVENESKQGLVLHYRSKRRGFTSYVMGQVTQLAKTFYDIPLEIELLQEEEAMDITHVILQLHFENLAYDSVIETQATEKLPVSSDLFFDTFPIHIVFRSDMQIVSVGSGIFSVLPHIMGMSVDEMFTLNRPLVEFNMENVMSHLNNVFEVMTIEAIKRTTGGGAGGSTESGEDEEEYDPDDKTRCLKIKGQMIFMEEWDAALFLGVPVMEDLDKMFKTGLFINDLSMHDSSRDLVLAGTQQQVELKMAMALDKSKSAKLDVVSKNMGAMETKVMSLMNSSLPRAISRNIIKKEPIEQFSAVYEATSILVSEISGFNNCVQSTSPKQAMAMLNKMLELFDALSVKNKCNKIDCRNNEFMVCCGAPVPTKYHAVYVCDLAVDMMAACAQIPDPSNGGAPLKVKIGINTGSVMGGVYGTRIPQFDILGENVIAASQLAAATPPGQIQISAKTHAEVANYSFEFGDGASVECKGVGAIACKVLLQRAGGTTTAVADQVDETANVKDNITGFIPESDKQPSFEHYKPVA